MIPKKIHYVWLGNNSKNELVRSCINSWKKNLPDYQIIEWNEKNWDIEQNRFAFENYKAGKYAYTSDVIRLDVLKRFGGIYLDSDVLIHRSFNDLLDLHSFWGMMYDDAISTATIGTEPNNKFIDYLLEKYKKFDRQMILNKEIPDNNNGIISCAMLDYYPDFKLKNSRQKLPDQTVIFPKEYFEFPTYNKSINYGEHLFTKTWSEEEYSFIHNFLRKHLPNLIGKVAYGKIRSYRGAKRYEYVRKHEVKRNTEIRKEQ